MGRGEVSPLPIHPDFQIRILPALCSGLSFIGESKVSFRPAQSIHLWSMIFFFFKPSGGAAPEAEARGRRSSVIYLSSYSVIHSKQQAPDLLQPVSASCGIHSKSAAFAFRLKFYTSTALIGVSPQSTPSAPHNDKIVRVSGGCTVARAYHSVHTGRGEIIRCASSRGQLDVGSWLGTACPKSAMAASFCNTQRQFT